MKTVTKKEENLNLISQHFVILSQGDTEEYLQTTATLGKIAASVVIRYYYFMSLVIEDLNSATGDLGSQLGFRHMENSLTGMN